MRGLLIFLACAVAVMLASPFFWSIVRMETSAERVGYTNAEGVTQWAWLGSEAPWPEWALRPEGARMRGHYVKCSRHAADLTRAQGVRVLPDTPHRGNPVAFEGRLPPGRGWAAWCEGLPVLIRA